METNTTPSAQTSPSALAAISQALIDLKRRAVPTAPLAGAYAALSPVGHARAAARDLDLAFVARAFALGGADLLAARHLVVRDEGVPCFPVIERLGDETCRLRAEAQPVPGADGLALMCGLHIEAQKAARLLGDGAPRDAAALSAMVGGDVLDHFPSPVAAHDAVRALLQSPDDRTVVLRQTAPEAEPSPTLRRPTIVLAGRTAVAHELFSPLGRRLAPELQSLVGGGTTADLIVAVFELCSAEPAVHHERCQTDAGYALSPSRHGVHIDTAALTPDGCAPEVRPALGALRAVSADLFIAAPTADLPSLFSAAAARGEGDNIVGVVALGEHLGRPEAVSARVHKSAAGVVTSHVPFADTPGGRSTGVPSLGLCAAANVLSGQVHCAGWDAALRACAEAQHAGHLSLDTPVRALSSPAGDVTAAIRLVTDALGHQGAAASLEGPPQTARPTRGLR